MQNVELRIIDYGTVDYQKELDLRDSILRQPLALSIYDEDLLVEKNDIHLGAFLNEQLVATLLLHKITEDIVKMRQVAVKKSLQKKGIGTKIIKKSEKIARQAGFKKIVLHARETAIAFYEKLGYHKVSKMFLELNIPHIKMEKILLEKIN